MKTLRILSTIVLISVFGFANQGFSQKKIDKKYQQFQDKANKMNKKGALAVVGIATEDAGRHDIGKRKAIAKAAQEMSENKRNYVEATTHDFIEAVGVGTGSEHNDVFQQIIDLVSANILKGTIVADFDFYRTKANKKEGTNTYMVLYVISPEYTYQSIRNELQKGSEENIYQRYMDSEYKKQHDKKIEQFKNEFEAD